AGRGLQAGSSRLGDWQFASYRARPLRIRLALWQVHYRAKSGECTTPQVTLWFSGIASTSTVMPRKSDGAPVQVPETGIAWRGSRVTATRTSLCPPAGALVGYNSTQPPPGR